MWTREFYRGHIYVCMWSQHCMITCIVLRGLANNAPCGQTHILWHTQSVVDHKWGAPITVMIMGQSASNHPCKYMLYGRLPNISVLRPGTTCNGICLQYISSRTHSSLRFLFTIKAPASTNTPSAEILLFLRLQKCREQKRKVSGSMTAHVYVN